MNKIRARFAMQKYDVTPFQLSEWKKKGLITDYGKSGFVNEEEVVAMLKGVAIDKDKVRLAAKNAVLTTPNRSTLTNKVKEQFVSIKEFAEAHNVTVTCVSRWKKRGYVWGPRGKVCVDCVPPREGKEFHFSRLNASEAAKLKQVNPYEGKKRSLQVNWTTEPFS